ncbi:Nrap protein [Lipomyces oligophaga]|uniref:Nrap protein n=1 Tax=Lipomyces oligophaga TaxID=45792 RepID=UPI0034CD6063
MAKRKREGNIREAEASTFAKSSTAVQVEAEIDLDQFDQYSDGFDQDEDESETDEQDEELEKPEKSASSENKKRKFQGKTTHLADELRNLQEAALLYKSNIFKMEIDALLAELKVDELKTKPVDRVLHKLKDFIESIPESPEFLLADAEKAIRKTGVSIPFPDPKPSKDVQYRFKFAPPSEFNLSGSYILKTMVKDPQHFSVDVIVSMPDSLFTEKDILNYRYFHKRAFYLAYIASQLNQNGRSDFKIQYDLLDGDFLRPVLRLDSLKEREEYDFHKAKCFIRIIPSISSDVFPLSKLGPSRNCVRYEVGNDLAMKPTAFYNSSVLSDLSHFDSTVFLNKSIRTCDGFRDACKLGYIWLRQRGFSSSVAGGGFGLTEWSVLMAVLLQGGGNQGARVLARGFSNYQLFKATLNYIASTDLTATPVSLNSDGLDFDKNDFNGTPILIFNDSNYNMLYRMSPSSYDKLRHEAALTVSELNDVNGDQFDSVFTQRVSSNIYQYDLTLHFQFTAPDKVYRDSGHIFNPSFASDLLSKAYQILKRGLGSRASLISLEYSDCPPWKIMSRKPAAIEGTTFTVGLLLNSEESEKLLTQGPSAEDKQSAAEFRAFWGEKAELRRFKDGSITESVVWSPSKEYNIVAQIAKYLFDRHFGSHILKGFAVGHANLTAYFNSDSDLGNSDALAQFQKNQDGFDMLRKLLIDIDDLPLRVHNVVGASDRLRYASVKAPVEYVLNDEQGLSEVVIELETTSKWPEDLKAVQYSKAAFLLAIGESLARLEPGIECRSGLDCDLDTIQNFAYLDVLMPIGYGYRVRIQTDRETAMLKNYKADKDLGFAALRSLNKDFTLLSRHTTEFSTFCHRFPFLSATVRRVKKWFHSHFLSPQVEDVVIELITLSIFLMPRPWATPNSPTTGFLRTLHFLAQWDWRADPLILDADGSLSVAEIQNIREAFRTQRESDPDMSHVAMFIAINYEKSGIVWTQERPSKVVCARITALARASCALIQTSATRSLAMDEYAQLFVSRLSDFDFVLYLEKRVEASGTSDSASLGYPPPVEALCVESDLYFRELESVFEGTALFFKDSTRNNAIAGLWNPRILVDRPLKVYLGYSSRPLSNRSITANTAAMVAEMANLGGDLVWRVEQKKVKDANDA